MSNGNKEEEKVEEKTTPEAVPATEEKTPEGESAAETETQEKAEDSIYKQELDNIKDKLAKAEYKLTEKDKAEREAKKAASESTSDIQEQVDSRFNEFKTEMTQGQIDQELNKIENAEEKELTKNYYETRLTKTGFTQSAITEDIENARLLANKKKYQKRESEILKAATQGRNVSGTADIAGEMGEVKKPTNLSDRERIILARSGQDENNIGKPISELLK